MILDIIVILFILLSAFTGYRKGLIGILVSLVGFVIAIILAFTFQPIVVDYINNNTQISPTINEMVKNGVTKAIEQKTNTSKSNDFYAMVISKFGENQDVDVITKNITSFILKGISFIFIFIIVITITFILQMLLNLVFNIPILSSVNKIGGIGIAAIMAIIKVWVILALVSFLSPFNIVGVITNLINQTTFTKLLYENNVLVSIISSNLKIW